MPRERKYTPAAEDQRDYPADFAEVAAGNGRPLHIHFGQWVGEKTEARSHFKTQKEYDAFVLGAQFGIRYRMDHQSAVDGAHAFHAEQAENRDAAADERAARAAERKAARKTEPVEDEAPAPKRRGRPAKAAEPVEEAPAPKRRGRPARAAAAETPEPKASAPAAPKTTSKPVRRPAANTRPGRPARKGSAATEPAF